MATEVKSKPNIFLLLAIAGGLLIAQGNGWIHLGPQPAPTPSPIPAPNPVPTPPNPTPEPTPPIETEKFPELPAAYAAISAPINSSLFKKETAEDALNYARFFRDSATALRLDETVTSNDHFKKVYNQALISFVAAHPSIAPRNAGLGKAIDDVLATQGLDIASWDASKRNAMADAMNAISYRCLEAYQTFHPETKAE